MRQAAFTYIYVSVVITLFLTLLIFQHGFDYRLLAAWIALIGGSLLIARSLFGGSRAARRTGVVVSAILAFMTAYFLLQVALAVWKRISVGHLTIFTALGILVLMIMCGGYMFATHRLVYRSGPSS